ncbi:diguanylate cyclase domain-containing protein [Permianibacter aggregans]|uniref:diguanylate cyclase n=1 Tax=Permianibacter aggregans TaxID=1510150 RepID=A0A4R6UPB9_9GAMM|nr:diguanylate cyclase [Permianibacter aggregans]QGX40242.1 diguanylate cyclase [Permianibacter aggregans]TDQ47499.1 diguanylate cyclase (GGDEF)-like protein [Permianibacter aggregans]
MFAFHGIRSKILVVILSAALALMLLLALLFVRFVGPSFLALEQDSAGRDMQRVMAAIDQQRRLIALMCGDWASWTEMYAYARQYDEAFYQNNLTAENASTTGMDMIAVVTADGRLRETHFYRNGEHYQPVIESALAPESPYFPAIIQPLLRPVHSEAERYQQRHLMLYVEDHPILIVARPITLEHERDPAGVLLMMRALDRERIDELSRNASVEFMLRPAGAMRPIVSIEGDRFLATLANGSAYDGVVADKLLWLWRPIPEFYGDQVYTVLSLPRTLTLQAFSNLYWAIILLCVFTLVLAFVLYRVLLRELLNPLRVVTDGLRNIEQNPELNLQLQEVGASELRRLIRSFNSMNEELNDYRREIELLSLTDPLTGLPNRRQFEQVIAREWLHAVREKTALTLMIVDVDWFKRYNDFYGHQAGDHCLIAISEALQKAVKRSTDLVARIGGEEFIVVLPQTEIAGGKAAAQRALDIVRDLHLVHEAGGARKIVTISVGVKSGVPSATDTIDDWLTQADQALYRAKQQGRDRFDIADEREPSAKA